MGKFKVTVSERSSDWDPGQAPETSSVIQADMTCAIPAPAALSCTVNNCNADTPGFGDQTAPSDAPPGPDGGLGD